MWHERQQEMSGNIILLSLGGDADGYTWVLHHVRIINLGIFLNCSNIHYLLRVLSELHFKIVFIHLTQNCVQILNFNRST
jgi:hypothetical protein